MIYLFLGIPRRSYNPADPNRQQFRIQADCFAQANSLVRQQHAREFMILPIGQVRSDEKLVENRVKNPINLRIKSNISTMFKAVGCA